jgi:putative acetyltransferase
MLKITVSSAKKGDVFMLTVRPEKRVDYPAIHKVNLLAFKREVEARLVEAIRRSADFVPELSLVAVKDGQVVGHILFSHIAVETKGGSVSTLALSVMSVLPQFQNQGIGSELVRNGLEKCRNLGYREVIVVGHPNFYPRFGFTSARAKGLEAPFPVPDDAFMALELAPGALDGMSGMVKYPPAFDEAT